MLVLRNLGWNELNYKSQNLTLKHISQHKSYITNKTEFYGEENNVKGNYVYRWLCAFVRVQDLGIPSWINVPLHFSMWLGGIWGDFLSSVDCSITVGVWNWRSFRPYTPQKICSRTCFAFVASYLNFMPLRDSVLGVTLPHITAVWHTCREDTRSPVTNVNVGLVC